MERLGLQAKLRSGGNKKGELNRLRKQDQVPGVVYGRGKENLPVLLDGRLLRQALSSGAGSNAIIELQIENGDSQKEKTTETVMFKEVQRDILVRDRLLHVDFIRISMQEKMVASVPVQIVGESDSPGVTEGGIVQVLLREVEVYCLPASIPDSIEVDISALNLGESLVANDLVLPEGVELSTDPEETVVLIAAPSEEVEPEEEEEAAEEAAEEGQEPAVDEGDEESAEE